MSTSEQNNNRANRTGATGGERRPQSGRRRRKKRSLGATIVVRFFQVLGTLLLIGIVTGCFVACYATFYIQTVIIPDSGLDLSQYTLNESSVIYYEDAETGQAVELTTLSGEENREWIDYEDIPRYFIDAAVAIEDKDFWTHQGVDWSRTAAAVLYMFTGQDIQGGSTITQQLIKNLTENDDVTVKRKIGEIFNALEFEKDYEKEDIITWYLNKIYLGKKNYGIVTASRYYFGKEVSEITLAEAASIIAITNNPSIYGPESTVVIENSNGELWTAKQWNKYRQEVILYQMLDQGYITRSEYDAAVEQELEFVFDNAETEISSDSVFSWYVEAVIDEVLDYLVEEHHLSKELAYDIIYGGGLAIYTPYDPYIQACVNQVYNSTENLPYTSKDGQQMQSSITIVDNSNGHVVALAGAIGEKTSNRVLNNATDSPRQPGSSIKPLSAYSPAIEMGLVTPASIIDDSPYMMNAGENDEEKAWPRNDNNIYSGLTTVKVGITKSLNTIATKLVADYVTPQASYQFLTERYGITTLVESLEKNGQIKTDIDIAPLAMGGLTRGVTTYEMASAFATFPRAGAYTEPTVVLRVETKAGELIWDNEPETEYVIKESTAYYMNDLLYNAANYGTGTQALVSGQNVAGKTGTTSENNDRWFAGYTPYYTGVVWTGYPIPAKITGTNGNPAAVLWQKVMTLVHEGLEKRSFFSVNGTTTVSICLDCGQIATEACSNDIRNVLAGTSRIGTFTFVSGDAPTSYCTCHVPITICTDDPILNEDETATGAYHLAGEFCPEESVMTVYIVDYQRSEVGSSVYVQDMPYMTAYYEGLEIVDCTVHLNGPEVDQPLEPGNGEQEGTPSVDWSTFDPYDMSTWPFDPYSDPSTWPFDPYDPSTWPDSGSSGGAQEETPETPSEPPEDAEEYVPAGP